MQSSIYDNLSIHTLRILGPAARPPAPTFLGEVCHLPTTYISHEVGGEGGWDNEEIYLCLFNCLVP